MLTSGGLGTMGLTAMPRRHGGVPGRAGKNRHRHRRATASFLMTMFELPTIAEYNIPVKGGDPQQRFSRGMIKQWQDLFYNRPVRLREDEEPQLRGAWPEACGIPPASAGDRKEDVAKTVKDMLGAPGAGDSSILRSSPE